MSFEIVSWMKVVSWSLLGAKVSFDVWIISSEIRMSIESGAWSEKSQDLGSIEWLSSSNNPYWRNIRLMTKLDSPVVSEYLVGQELVEEEKARSKESAMIIKSSLIEKWKGKDGSHRLSLMLKSPVMRKTLSMLTSVSFRYFKAKWDKSE